MVFSSKNKNMSRAKKALTSTFASILLVGTFGFNANTADAISPPSAPDGYSYNSSTTQVETSSRSPEARERDNVLTILGVSSLAGGITPRLLGGLGVATSILNSESAGEDTTTYTYARYTYLADNPSTSYGGFYIIGVENNDTGEVEFSDRKRIGTGA